MKVIAVLGVNNPKPDPEPIHHIVMVSGNFYRNNSWYHKQLRLIAHEKLTPRKEVSPCPQ